MELASELHACDTGLEFDPSVLPAAAMLNDLDHLGIRDELRMDSHLPQREAECDIFSTHIVEPESADGFEHGASDANVRSSAEGDTLVAPDPVTETLGGPPPVQSSQVPVVLGGHGKEGPSDERLGIECTGERCNPVGRHQVICVAEQEVLAASDGCGNITGM